MTDQLANGPYTGNYVAGQNQMQTDAQKQAAAYGLGTGSNLVDNAAGTSGSLTANAGLYGSNAAHMAANGTQGPNRGVMNNLNSYASGNGMAGVQTMNPGLSAALNSAATQGAHAIGGFNSGISGIMNSAQADPTQGIINSAQQYANSGQTQSALDNVNRQIDQTLNEQTNPSFNRQAAAGGMLNSSRAGMGEAMNNENAAIAKGNADSAILNNAYNTGLSTAASQHTSGLNTALSAGLGGLSGNTALAQGNQNTQLATQLGEANSQNAAATTALGQQLNYQGLNANTQLAGNAQLGSGVSTGLAAANTAGTLAANNYSLGSAAGSAQQAGDQAGLVNAYQQWNGNNTYNSDVLNRYMGVVGTSNWGTNGTSSGTQTGPSSALANGLGGAAAANGLFGDGSGGSLAGNINGYWSAGQQYLNPYGATGNGMSPIVGTSGLAGGGV